MPRANLISTTSAGEKLRATRADSSRGRAIAPERKEMERTEKKVATEKRMVTYVGKISWYFGRREEDKISRAKPSEMLRSGDESMV